MEVDRQSPTGLIFNIIFALFILISDLFFMFPRLCQNLRFVPKFRRIWMIRC